MLRSKYDTTLYLALGRARHHVYKVDHKFSMGKMVAWRRPGAMLRKGSQGGSSELLTPEQQRKVDAHFVAELKQLGSDFPYHEFCDVTPGVTA